VPRSGARAEPASFDALVRDGQQPVMRYLLARTGSPTEAAELSQETFVRAYCALAKGQGPRHPIPWLLAIARNVFLEAARNQRYERQIAERMARVMGIAWQSPWQERLERRLIVASALEGLSPELREPVLLRYFGGLSLADVAAHLNITPGAAKTRLWRARQALRGQLEVLVQDTKQAMFTMPRDLAAQAKLIAQRPPIYETLSVGLQVGGTKWGTVPIFRPLFSGEQLSLDDVRFAVQQLHAARVAGDRLLAPKLELWPLLELFYHPAAVAIYSFLLSAEVGNEEFRKTGEGHLEITDGWVLGTDPHAPKVLAGFKQAGLRHIWFTFAGLEQTHDHLCRRAGAFQAMVTAMARCREAGIETGAGIIVSTGNAGEIAELAGVIRSLGAEQFIPTYVSGWSPDLIEYEDIRPEPEDLAGLPPGGMDVNWGYQDFWADVPGHTEAALTRAAISQKAQPAPSAEIKHRTLDLWVAPNLDLFYSEHGRPPRTKLANLRADSPEQVYQRLRDIAWPPPGPLDGELAERYGDVASRKLHMGLGWLRCKWLAAWQEENQITWLADDRF
jgi:RNA polymerase sigma factor (sigma-70 family)